MKNNGKFKQFLRKNRYTLLIVSGIIAWGALDIGLKYAMYKFGERDMARLIKDAIAYGCKNDKTLTVEHNGEKFYFLPKRFPEGKTVNLYNFTFDDLEKLSTLFKDEIVPGFGSAVTPDTPIDRIEFVTYMDKN